MADSSSDLKIWLEKELKSDRPTMLALFHLNAAGTADRAALDQRQVTVKDKPEELAIWIVQTCQDDAAAFGGVQRYKVVAVRQAPGVSVRKVLRFEPPLDEQPGTETGPDAMTVSGDSSRKEASSGRLLSELMDHNRQLIQMFLGGFNGLMVQWQTLNGTMSDIVKQQASLLSRERDKHQIEHVERKVEGVLEMELQMEREERDRKAKRDDKVFEQLSLLGPVIMGKLMDGGGGGGGGGSIGSGGGGGQSAQAAAQAAVVAAVSDAQTRSFFTSLSPDQQEQFITRLDDGQLAGYNAIMERLVKPGANGA